VNGNNPTEPHCKNENNATERPEGHRLSAPHGGSRSWKAGPASPFGGCAMRSPTANPFCTVTLKAAKASSLQWLLRVFQETAWLWRRHANGPSRENGRISRIRLSGVRRVFTALYEVMFSLSLNIPFADAATPPELRFAFAQLLEMFQDRARSRRFCRNSFGRASTKSPTSQEPGDSTQPSERARENVRRALHFPKLKRNK